MKAASPRGPERTLRVMLAAAAVATVGGAFLAATFARTAGAVMLLAGWIGLVVGLHRHGRLGEG